MKRPYRGRMIPIKKGGVNIQLCSQEKTLLKSAIELMITNLELSLESKKNSIFKRDLTYYKKIYTKLTKKKICPSCGEWI